MGQAPYLIYIRQMPVSNVSASSAVQNEAFRYFPQFF
jgi:hypothetical protein